MELGRSVLESQSLFVKSCWLWTDFVLLLLKMVLDEGEIAPESLCKRYRPSDFLYSRNDQYKIVDLHFFEKQHVEKYLLIDLFKFDDNFKIHYDEKPCGSYIKSVAANIMKGHHLTFICRLCQLIYYLICSGKCLQLL